MQSNQTILKRLPHHNQISLRGSADNISISLPTLPGSSIVTDNSSILWLGPDEWLVVENIGTTPPLLKSLSSIDNLFFVDVSHNRTILEFKGKKIREILQKICTVDLDKDVFKKRCVIQTLIGKSQAIIFHVEEHTFNIMVRNSFVNYVEELIHVSSLN